MRVNYNQSQWNGRALILNSPTATSAKLLCFISSFNFKVCVSTFKCSLLALESAGCLPPANYLCRRSHLQCILPLLAGRWRNTHLSVKYFIKGHVIPLPTQLHEASSCEVPVDGLVIGQEGCFCFFFFFFFFRRGVDFTAPWNFLSVNRERVNGDVWKKVLTDKIHRANLTSTIGTRQPHGGSGSRHVYNSPTRYGLAACAERGRMLMRPA